MVDKIDHVDVLIVGGGPVGLITAYQLATTLPPPHKIRIIEQYAKSSQDQYGRAITLFPRSSEMLDQLGLADLLAQQCFACRTTVSYDKDGNEVQGRGWSFMEQMKDTVWDFSLVLRQKYQEEIFREQLKKKGVALESPMGLVAVEVDERLRFGEYRVTATLEDGNTKEKSIVKCKYLIGADGGRSFVRRALQIPFDGSSSEDKWVRIDGVIDTDLPKPRSYCAIESPTHGNVLWAALDHGGTRIGFAFTKERERAYKVFNEEAAVKEAIASVKPFSLKFKQVDWWTIYVVGQRIARNFFVKDSVFLAGDACHTHSSGAAQGMNTGLHDSVNLGWKLSLVLRGLAKPELLYTYESERKPNVQKLINYDKDISRLMTMQLPEGWTGDPNADPNVVLGVVMAEAATFSSGLGIYYEADNVLSIQGSFAPAASANAVVAGKRVPDAALQKPGTFEATRLHRETPNTGRFHVAVFAGDPSHTGGVLAQLFLEIEKSSFFSNASLPISWLTISTRSGPSAVEVLGAMPYGKVFYDQQLAAHSRFGVESSKGAVFVLRPDGWVGTATTLGSSTLGEIERYFRRFLSTGLHGEKVDRGIVQARL
ncbi:FAD/NAD(P)-binding domain-containing protein [Rhizodiscina lignyota]|uniref:FAD/NAD(P)-binding domain-containing protein n=1 Tax=Rhizodiscina lignyota TaxID=1504668 RepID=A0A9P4IEI8_9PEZI|nr:FAD/NAD(P)-binding domain-containing protein [Rhizodiscina lignyota]